MPIATHAAALSLEIPTTSRTNHEAMNGSDMASSSSSDCAVSAVPQTLPDSASHEGQGQGGGNMSMANSGIQVMKPNKESLASLDDYAVPCTTFPKYSRLPAELRIKIITTAINIPHLIDYRTPLGRQHITRSLYFVNKETRFEVLRHIKLCSPTVTRDPLSYFNPSWDLVFAESYGDNDADIMWKLPSSLERPGLQTMALPLQTMLVYDCVWIPPAAFAKLTRQLIKLPGLREVLLVRALPRWMNRAIFPTKPCSKESLHKKDSIPKLMMHPYGTFYSQHEEVESWFRKAKDLRSQVYYSGGGLYSKTKKFRNADIMTGLVASLIFEDDELVAKSGNQENLLTRYEPEMESKDLERRFQTVQWVIQRLYDNDGNNQTTPKFTVVYEKQEE